MKRSYYLLVLLCFFSIASCTKLEKSMQGTYFTDTVDGMLYLDLMDGGNCIAYFQGGEEDSGYWHITDSKEISLTVTPKKDRNGWTVRYWISTLSEKGEIYDNGNFSVPATRSYRGDSEDKTLFFKKDSRK